MSRTRIVGGPVVPHMSRAEVAVRAASPTGLPVTRIAAHDLTAGADVANLLLEDAAAMLLEDGGLLLLE